MTALSAESPQSMKTLMPLPEDPDAMTVRYAVPLYEGQLSAHFGHCREFAFVDADEDGGIVAVTHEIPPPHEPGALPQWLEQNAVERVIAGGMGRRAQGLFEQSGIQVITGAPVASPEALVRAHLDGSLSTGANICDH
jgi:predicted Fe-Mo cluster-binding NifX family protein